MLCSHFPLLTSYPQQIKLSMEFSPRSSVNSSAKYSPLKVTSETKFLYGIYTSKKLKGENEIEAAMGVVFDGYTIVSQSLSSSLIFSFSLHSFWWSSLQGVGIFSHRLSPLQDAWISFEHLQNLCSFSNSSSMFPCPVTTQQTIESQDNVNSSLVYFIFETPQLSTIVPFVDLCGMTLVSCLRKYPSILRTWCIQLGTCYRELQELTDVSLRSPTLEDVFIRNVCHFPLYSFLSFFYFHSLNSFIHSLD